MEPAIKVVVTLLVIALAVVVGLIALTSQSDDAAVATKTPVIEATAQPEATEEPQATQMPADEATTSDVSETTEAQTEEAQDEDLYEGALAGLSDEEIAAMALAEEQSAARNDSQDGDEGAVD